MKTVPFRIQVFVLLATLMGLTPAAAAAQDVDAMAKWTAYTVVHYKVVGEFAGPTPLLAVSGMTRQAQVTDRVEFELDWSQEDFKVVGTPVIRNFPSNLGAIASVANCPAPRVEGPFELLTLVAIKGDGPMAMSSIVGLQGKKELPAGSIPSITELGCQKWNAVTAKSEAVELLFQLPPAMMMAMPGGAFALSADRKSLIFKSAGWTWTCTPTGVK